MPDITNCVFSNNIIRPLETVSLTSRTSDGLTPIIENVVDNSNKLSTNGSSITCAAVTEPSSGWAGIISGSYVAEITLRHPLNKLIIRKFSSVNILRVRHYTSSDINVTLSTYSTYNLPGIKINIVDSTQISGGAKLDSTALPSDFTYANNTLVTSSAISAGTKAITFYLKNDIVVSKRYNIVISTFNPLEIVPNGNISNKLPLFCYKQSDNSIQLSPYSYPIRVVYPTNFGTISRLGFSKKDIVVENLCFGYKDENTFYPLNEDYKSKTIWLSELLNFKPTTEKEYLISFGIPDFIMKSELLLGNTINDKLCIKFKISYKPLDTLDEISKDVEIFFDKYLNRIIPFETNKYLNGEDIPGSVIRKPVNYASEADFISQYLNDCGINQLSLAIKNIVYVYFNQTYNGTQIVSSQSGMPISTATDKYRIELLLSYMNSLSDSINTDSSLRILNLVRSKIAIGKYIMWDDNLDHTSDGQLNVTDTVYTASPWKELYNSIKNIQYMKKYRICYKDSNTTYGLKYRVGNTDYNIMAWR